jgi:hypothetical protein
LAQKREPNAPLSFDTAKESFVSVTPKLLLRLNSLIEKQELQIVVSPSAMNLQPSSFRVCSLEIFWRLPAIEAVTCYKKDVN